MTTIIPPHLLPNWKPPIIVNKSIPQQSLTGSQVVNLLHSGFNVSSNNSTQGQNLIISENPNIIPNQTNNNLTNNNLTNNNLTPLLIIGGLILAIIILKQL